jgi:putative tricarboxylic transport membrane protein
MEISIITSLAVLIGLIAGTFAGLIPGIGVFACLLMLYPLLDFFSGLDIILMYSTIFAVSQFVGSIPSTVFGIPGEASSLPAVREGHRLYKRGLGQFAISSCAMGSAIGSIIACLLTLSLVPFMAYVFNFYNTTFQVVLLSIVLLIIALNSQSKLLITLPVMLAGYYMAAIGYNVVTFNTFSTFGIQSLEQGLPLYGVMFALFVMPELLKANKRMKNGNILYNIQSKPINEHFMNVINHKWSVIRGTVIGYFTGMIPGVSIVASSNVSYAIEKKIRGNKYNQNGDIACLISAETANNAGAFSVLIPLLVLGIPITGSEALLYEYVAVKKYLLLGYELFLNSYILETVAILIVFVNIIAVFIAWPLSKQILWLYKVPTQYLYVFIGLLGIFAVWFTGHQYGQETFYLLSTTLMLPLGYILYKLDIDTLPLVFVYLIQNNLEAGLYRFYQLYT